MCQAFGGSTATVFLKIQEEVESRKAIHPHLAIGSMRWLHATLGIACLLYKLGTAEHEGPYSLSILYLVSGYWFYLHMLIKNG